MSKVIQLSFSDEEYAEVQNAAKQAGISLTQYAKGRILTNSEFQTHYNELLSAVVKMRNGTKFNIKAVFGLQWASISKGTRLALGREFFKQVSAGTISSISPTVKDATNTQWYIKEEADR